MSGGYKAHQKRMEWFEATMRAQKAYTAPPSLSERYEAAREDYVTGKLSLEDFTARVVELLREGL